MKRPGRNCVEPRKAAAKAGSSKVGPNVTEGPDCEVYTRPPTPARPAEHISEIVVQRSTRTPDNRAASRSARRIDLTSGGRALEEPPSNDFEDNQIHDDDLESKHVHQCEIAPASRVGDTGCLEPVTIAKKAARIDPIPRAAINESILS